MGTLFFSSLQQPNSPNIFFGPRVRHKIVEKEGKWMDKADKMKSD